MNILFWILVVIILMAIGGYSIVSHCGIFLVVIDDYSINGYYIINYFLLLYVILQLLVIIVL